VDERTVDLHEQRAGAWVVLGRSGDAPSGARPVRADLEALPFRRGAVAGAVASYVHLPRPHLPLALADLHRSLADDAPVELLVPGDDQEHAPPPDADRPGRRSEGWPLDLLGHVVHGAGLEPVEVEARPAGGRGRLRVVARRATTLPDVVGPGMRILVCGLNPSVYSARRGVGYARPGNRFWPAALAAGIVSVDRDPLHALRRHGIGMTDLVKRATVAAAELMDGEYRDGLARVERLCEWLRPATVCFVGLAGWRAAVDRRATPGPQARRLGGSAVYLMPSTSGLNASTQLPAHAAHLRAAAALADEADASLEGRPVAARGERRPGR
jgi:double-stranded uracil-DNA glycosylase